MICGGEQQGECCQQEHSNNDKYTVNGPRRCDASNYIADNLPQDYDLKLVNKVADKIIEQNLLKENEMVGISYSNSRLKEIEQGKLSKKNKGGI